MRASGILLHITSLPGPYGIGTMGKEATRFVDFLERAGQRYWQLLPLTPTGYGNSPYQSCSCYAGNPFLIDLPMLAEQGLLTQKELTAPAWGSDPEIVDFGCQYENKWRLLRRAFSNFTDFAALDTYIRRQQRWLLPYAEYMARKAQNGNKPWRQWEHTSPISQKEIRFYCFTQYLFHTQWERLRNYAHSKGISIIGDVPIYVPYDSVEVWSEPQWFSLDAMLTPTALAGCPPDEFSPDGQLWGNPLYRWDRLKEDNYRWWLNRLTAAAERYDVLRLDHFRGFADYYAIPYGAKTAKEGKWLPGPGWDFIKTLQAALPDTPMIAEDLGFLTENVHTLRKLSGYPGMKVLSFAFDGDKNNPYLPHTYSHNTVCYTGTHDNMPLKQWYDRTSAQTKAFANAYMGAPADIVWGMLRLALGSPSDLVIVPMQDYLGLGAESRMNTPGTCGPHNWSWRARADVFADRLAERIRELTCTYGRLQ